MTLRKKTVDKNVRYIPKSEQTKEIKLNKTTKKHKVNKFKLFQEEVNQTQENKTKIFHKTIKSS